MYTCSDEIAIIKTIIYCKYTAFVPEFQPSYEFENAMCVKMLVTIFKRMIVKVKYSSSHSHIGISKSMYVYGYYNAVSLNSPFNIK